jgi:hypothetical protein
VPRCGSRRSSRSAGAGKSTRSILTGDRIAARIWVVHSSEITKHDRGIVTINVTLTDKRCEIA